MRKCVILTSIMGVDLSPRSFATGLQLAAQKSAIFQRKSIHPYPSDGSGSKPKILLLPDGWTIFSKKFMHAQLPNRCRSRPKSFCCQIANFNLPDGGGSEPKSVCRQVAGRQTPAGPSELMNCSKGSVNSHLPNRDGSQPKSVCRQAARLQLAAQNPRSSEGIYAF